MRRLPPSRAYVSSLSAESPVSAAEKKVRGPQAEPQTETIQKTKKRRMDILVICSRDELKTRTREALSEMGFLGRVDNIEEAKRLLTGMNFQLIIIDVRHNGLQDSYRLTHWILKHIPRTRVLLLGAEEQGSPFEDRSGIHIAPEGTVGKLYPCVLELLEKDKDFGSAR